MNSFDFRKFPEFKLRPDLAEEIGFLDHIRRPVPFEKYAARQANKMSGAAIQLSYDENCKTRSMLTLGRFFGIYGYQPPESDETVNVYTDGVYPLRVPTDGLFFDCMVRANVALGRSPDGPYAIVPNSKANAGRTNEPSHFIFYDSKKGRGYVVPYAMLGQVNWRMRVDD